MEDGDTEKYHASSVIQYFVFSSCKKICIRCISWQVYNKIIYDPTLVDLTSNFFVLWVELIA